MSEVKNIPEGWEETTLGELIDIFNQKRIPLSAQVRTHRKGIYPYYGASNIFDYIDDYIFDGEYLLISEDGENLNTRNTPIAFIVKGKFWVNNHAHIVKGKSKHLTKYLELYFSKLDISAFITGAVQPKLSKGNLINIPILLPKSEVEQKSIAAILTAFDDKIELLQAQNKTLEETAQTIFAEWFGKYQIEDELPDGWRVGKLSDIADFLNGLALQKYPPIIGQETLPVIKIRELKQGITSNTDRANKNLAEKYIIENGDVLFSWSGSLEVVIWQYGQGALNQHLFKVTSEKYPKWFYYQWLLFHLNEFKSIAATKATTMGHINRNHLDLAEIIIPNDERFNELNNLFNPLLDKLETNNAQIQTLTKTRDELLPRLMSGELRVNEFKKIKL